MMLNCAALPKMTLEGQIASRQKVRSVSCLLIDIAVGPPHSHGWAAVWVFDDNLQAICQYLKDCMIGRLLEQDSVSEGSHSPCLKPHDSCCGPIDSPFFWHLALNKENEPHSCRHADQEACSK